MTEPEAGGQRFIATDEFLWLEQVAAVLRERLGDEASKVPTRKAPNFADQADEHLRQVDPLDQRRPRQALLVLEREGANDAGLEADPGRRLDRRDRPQPALARRRLLLLGVFLVVGL